MKRFLVAAVAIAAFVVPLAATADASTTSSFQARSGKIWGMIPPVDMTAGTQVPNSAPASGSLYYNGGPVMPTTNVYTIFWQPSGYTLPNGYATNLNQYFKDLQADNGKNTNSYVNATQYYQVNKDGTKTYVQNKTTFAGTTLDTNALPPLDPVNCPDTPAAVQGNPGGAAGCVTDAQLQQEISKVIKAKGWPVNNTTEYFVFTAPNIGTCFPAQVGVDSGAGAGTTVVVPLCSFSYFCAYHSAYSDSTISTSQIIYSNMPYAAQTYGNPLTCDLGEYPNNNPSDPEVSITSHEHEESITDPFGTGWWDSNPDDSAYGEENGDMCAWDFGTTTGDSGDYLTGQPGVAWNQTINGHHYLMQLEWDNSTNGCPGSDADGNPTAGPNYDTPTITLTPNTGKAGSAFKVAGQFFAANDNVWNTFDDAAGTKFGIGSLYANSSGHYTLSTKVPLKAVTGTATVTGMGNSGHPTSTFTVTK